MPSTPLTKRNDRVAKSPLPRQARSGKSPRRDRSRSQRSGCSLHQYIPPSDERASINRLCFDIADAAKDRPEFTLFDPDVAALTDKTFVRFGTGSFVDLRSTRADLRSHFLTDAKKTYRFKPMKMIQGIFAAPPPVKRGRDIDSVEFADALTPQRLESLRPDFPTIAGALRLAQEMVNASSEEVARGGANPQPFHPYVVPIFHEHP